MKAILTLCAAVLSFSLFAQNAVDEHYSTYADDSRFSHISISAKMFELFTHIEGETDEEKKLRNIIFRLNSLDKIKRKERGIYVAV